MQNGRQALSRRLNVRHIRFIALGSAIGTGLFYGSSETIDQAGPAVLLAYLLGGLAVFFVLRSLGEMAVDDPVPGSFGEYATRHLGPLAGFITGWSYTFEMIIVCLADVTALAVYMGFWFPDTPRWIWVVLTLAVLAVVNLVNVRVFGEVEFWFSLIKIVAIVAMILGGIALLVSSAFSTGAGDGQPALSNLWEHGGFFPTGAEGFLLSFTVVMFAFGGTEIIGITAGEADNPRTAIPRAINTVPARILLFYVLALGVIMSLTPWNHIGTSGSPFVHIFNSIGLPWAAGLLNIVVITAALSAINSDLYGAGRMLYGMAQRGQAPAAMRRVSRHGAPTTTVVIMMLALLIGAVLNYLIPERVFTIIASLATFATIWVWVMILLAHLASRRRMTERHTTNLGFPVPLWPYGQIGTLVFMGLVLVLMAFTPDTRIALLTGLVWLVVITAAYWWGTRRGTHQPVTDSASPSGDGQ